MHLMADLAELRQRIVNGHRLVSVDDETLTVLLNIADAVRQRRDARRAWVNAFDEDNDGPVLDAAHAAEDAADEAELDALARLEMISAKKGDLYPVGTEVLFRSPSEDVFIGRIDFVADYSGMGSHFGDVRYLVFPLACQIEDDTWIDRIAHYHRWCHPDELLVPDGIPPDVEDRGKPAAGHANLTVDEKKAKLDRALANHRSERGDER